MSHWITYQNGDYTAHINSNTGTKIRDDNNTLDPKPEFAENCDITITTKCSQECDFCYLGCNKNGKDADILKYNFIYHLHPYTEFAINGNDLNHPQFVNLLELLKSQNVFANITVNQNQFLNNIEQINKLYDDKLIHGIGISVEWATDNFINQVKQFPTAVIHTICGITGLADYYELAEQHLKILILGYKDLGRGHTCYKQYEHEIRRNQKQLHDILPTMIAGNWFDTLSFDNLAIEQLDVKTLLSDEQWESFYMGDDGQFTFYLDLVNNTFAKSSIDKPLGVIDNKSIDEMFEIVQNS